MRKIFLAASIALGLLTGTAHAEAPEVGDDTITGLVANSSG